MSKFVVVTLLCSLMGLTGCLVEAVEKEAELKDFLDAEIATVGMDHSTGVPVVLLRDLEHGHTIPIWIGFSEAQSIMQALHNIPTPRPMTHDLTVQILAFSGVNLKELLVHDMREGIFYGMIRMRVPGEDDVVEVDCRPSDGLALALRTGARIRVARHLLGDMPDVDFVPPDAVDQVVQVLGLTIVTVTDDLRQEFELADRTGVVVTAARSNAAKIGFRRGDLIIEVNGLATATPMEFLEEVMRTAPGRETGVRIWRDGIELDLKLPVADESEERTIPI